MIAAERTRESEVFADRVHRPEGRNQEYRADSDAETRWDVERARVGGPDRDCEQGARDEEGEEDHTPDDEARVIERACQPRVAQLTSP